LRRCAAHGLSPFGKDVRSVPAADRRPLRDKHSILVEGNYTTGKPLNCGERTRGWPSSAAAPLFRNIGSHLVHWLSSRRPFLVPAPVELCAPGHFRYGSSVRRPVDVEGAPMPISTDTGDIPGASKQFTTGG
jgi:hypothetical protein